MNENHDILTRIDFEAQHRQYLADSQSRYEKAIETLPPRLMALGVAIVNASYSGCGDSGQIDEVEYLTPKEDPVSLTVPNDLQEEVETFLYDALESRHGGWENNEGGEGEFRWMLATNGLEHTHRDLYIEADTTEHTGFDDLLAGKERTP
jgi:hypothetical protein